MVAKLREHFSLAAHGLSARAMRILIVFVAFTERTGQLRCVGSHNLHKTLSAFLVRF